MNVEAIDYKPSTINQKESMKNNKLIHLDQKAIRRIIKFVKLVAGLASIFKAFNWIASFFDFITRLFDRD
jgi:membrane protein YqaA with SNARE-associated domain